MIPRSSLLIALLIVALIPTGVMGADQTLIGGDRGYYLVHAGVDGATVTFDGTVMGTTQNGVLKVQVYTTATPYRNFTVTKVGYQTYNGQITDYPAKDQTVDLIATLQPLTTTTTTTQTLIGGDQGYYLVHTGVDGATVTFDDTVMGTTQNGVLNVPVYTTATPFRNVTVTKAGYQTYNGQITDHPAKGQTVDLYATLQPLTTTTVTATANATTAQTLIGGDQGYYLVHAGVDGATVIFDGTVMGTTQNSVLKVQVYTTATPYRNFTVTKAGYQTYNGQITGYPAKDQTIDLYATLQPLTTTASNDDTSVIGGDQGWYLVHSNVDGASIAFDGTAKGTIQGGVLKVQVYTTGTPYKTFTATKNGYQPFSGQITSVPSKGGIIDLYANLTPLSTTTTTNTTTVQTTTNTLIGGDQGWYLIHSNAEGANVSFDSTPEGTITNGTLKVMVYVTGTPFKNITVTGEGFSPLTINITTHPAKGETVDIIANLTPLTPTTTQKSGPELLPLLVGLGLIGLGLRRKEE